MATKNSIKDVARVEKLPLNRSNALCKAIPDRLPDGLKMNLINAIKCTPELRDAEASTAVSYTHLFCIGRYWSENKSDDSHPYGAYW